MEMSADKTLGSAEKFGVFDPCLLPHCLQACLWCLSLGGHTDHCHSCVIYLHPGPGDQPDRRGPVLGSVFGGGVYPCQAVKAEVCPESPIMSVL